MSEQFNKLKKSRDRQEARRKASLAGPYCGGGPYVVITVSGGVAEVHSVTPGIDVHIVDWDNVNASIDSDGMIAEHFWDSLSPIERQVVRGDRPKIARD